MNLRQFLGSDPLTRFEHQEGRLALQRRFGARLPDECGLTLLPFVERAPWRYWDDATVDTCLQLLEADIDRTTAALERRTQALDRGFDALLRGSSLIKNEESRSGRQFFVALMTKWLPEYLRYTEHIYGNLLEALWSVAKRGGTDGTFDLRRAIHLFDSRNLRALTDGYSETVRNAIAHGNVRVVGQEVAFGTSHQTALAPFEVLDLLDRLVRVSNGIGVGILLFLERHRSRAALFDHLPPAVFVLFAAGAFNRTGCRVTGAVESETALAGRQLHIAIELNERHPAQVFGQCARLGFQLLQTNATGYDRLLCEIDQGELNTSFVIVRLPKLASLLREDADNRELPQAFDETQLLWLTESAWMTRLRAWRVILKSVWITTHREILEGWHRSGLWLGKGRCRVRATENISVAGIARVHVRAVMKNASDAQDRRIVNETIHELIRRTRRRFVPSRTGGVDQGVPWPKRPVHVFIDLYRHDGTIRWLKNGGWANGNIVAVAERTWKSRTPVLVTNPETTYKGTGIRYQIDGAAAAAAMQNVVRMAQRLAEQSRYEHTRH